MDNKKTIILVFLIIAGVVFLGVGYLGGVAIEKQKVSPQLEQLVEQLEKVAKTIKALSSKTVTSIVVFGEVTKISGRTITVTYGTESIDIPIKENAQIFSLENLVGESVIPQKKIEFEEIKEGNNLNVSINVLPTGELEGIAVVVFPPVLPRTP